MFLRRAIVIALAPLPLWACSNAAPEEQPPLVIPFQAGDGAELAGAGFFGTVEARTESALSFRLGGQIITRDIARGQVVKRGQVIARLDPADIGLALRAATADAKAAEEALKAAQALAQRASADAARLEGLVGAGGISQQQYDQAKAGAATANAEAAAAASRLAAARASASEVRNQNSYAALRADRDGVITDVLVEVGTVVAPGQPIVRLAQSGAREAVVTVPETRRANLPQTATAVLVDGSTIPATLKEVTGAADPITRSFTARYNLAASEKIAPGTSVSLFAKQSRSASAFGVPLAAVLDDGKGAGVWIIGKGGIIKRRPVTIGEINDGKAIISDGLKEGERVVALGAHLLTDGQKVRVGKLPQ